MWYSPPATQGLGSVQQGAARLGRAPTCASGSGRWTARSKRLGADVDAGCERLHMRSAKHPNAWKRHKPSESRDDESVTGTMLESCLDRSTIRRALGLRPSRSFSSRPCCVSLAGVRVWLTRARSAAVEMTGERTLDGTQRMSESRCRRGRWGARDRACAVKQVKRPESSRDAESNPGTRTLESCLDRSSFWSARVLHPF